MNVKIRAEAEAEWLALPVRERAAMRKAWRKLQATDDQLGFPHTSAVKGAAEPLRELRPRAGRSPWRSFYRRVGDTLVVAAIGPEAHADPRGFDRAVKLAIERLADEEEGQ